MDSLEKFTKAEKYFTSRLETGDIHNDGSRQEADSFLTVSIAVSMLYALGEDRLLELEKQGVVHHSTISGSSLGLAASTVNDYFNERLDLERDNTEQLERTCRSAKQIYETANAPQWFQ